MDIYAVFLDIDDTLTHNGSLPGENIDAIRAARSLGHKVFLNTGRSVGHIPDYVTNALELDGVVAGIGSHVICGNEALKRERFSPRELSELAVRFFAKGYECIFEGESRSICKNTEYGGKNRLLAESARDFIEKFSDVPITKVYIGGVLPEDEQELLNARYTFFQHGKYAEFAHKGCSKSDGMRLILGRLGIPVERCVAIGDSVNDLDMLDYAGISVAMGNASEDIKARCTLVTDTAENAGVAKALREILNLQIRELR